MVTDSFSLSPGIWWHLLFCQLRFKLDHSICDRHPEACMDPEDKGDCFNYFPWMAYLALASAWGKTLGAWCMQPCNYAFKSIFLINLNMLEKLTWLDSKKSCGLGPIVGSKPLKWELIISFVRFWKMLLGRGNQRLKIWKPGEKTTLIFIDYFFFGWGGEWRLR